MEIGFVARAHGLGGETVVELTTNRPGRLEPGVVLTLTDGTEVAVRSSSPLGGSRDRWLVRFAGVADRAGADRLRGQALLAEPVDDVDELWVHQLIGSTVRDSEGIERGRVTSVEANPASDLLVTDTGALVPLRFVTGSGPGWVHVEVPAGLFDL